MGEVRDVVLEVHGISKAFPGVQALKEVSFDLRRGEVHALVGENGAGKSTLMKILTGLFCKDCGEYRIEGAPIELRSVHHSILLGVSCIYQELTIVPLLDVATNIFLGHTPRKLGFLIDSKRMHREAQKILARLEMDIPTRILAKDLSVAQQQMLEIGRAISSNAKVIIMDEPTSSLTQKETDVLFRVIRSLSAEGVSIIYISHKLEEVLDIADRITVLRDGQRIATLDKETATKDIIVHHMIGRTIENYFHKVKASYGDVVFEAKGLKGMGFDDITFQVRSGEVVGFFGLVGAGRTEIMQTVFGVDRPVDGEIRIDGKPVAVTSTTHAIRVGLGLVPEDRKLEGLVLKMDVESNSTLVKMMETSRFGILDRKADHAFADRFVKALNIRTTSLSKLTSELSGGNQQKVVIAKWLMMNPKVLIMDEPTRGIDVAAKAEIYRLISELAGKGVGIVVVSSELPEILGICDRVITIYNGRITADVLVEETDSKRIMQAALGGAAT